MWTQIFLCAFDKMKAKVSENALVWTWPINGKNKTDNYK